MGPAHPEPRLKLQLHVEHVSLDTDNQLVNGRLDSMRFHAKFSMVLPLLQRLKSLRYTMSKWDAFTVHRIMGHHIIRAPRSLTSLTLVVCSRHFFRLFFTD